MTRIIGDMMGVIGTIHARRSMSRRAGSFLKPLRAPPPRPEGRTACNGCCTRPPAAFPIEHHSAEGRRSLKGRALAAWLTRPAERHLFEPIHGIHEHRGCKASHGGVLGSSPARGRQA
jgi:hypothetical protein